MFLGSCLGYIAYNFVINRNWNKELMWNFAFNLKSLLQRHWVCFSKPMTMRQWIIGNVLTDVGASKVEENPWKMTSDLEDLAWLSPPKIYRKLISLCMMFAWGQSIILLMLLVCHMGPYRHPWHLNWTCGMLMSSLSSTSWALQKEHHVRVCQDLSQCAAVDPSYMSRIISGDRS